MEKTYVLVVDDNEAVRQALSVVLNLEKDIQVIGDAKDGEEAVKRASELSPDVVVMDFYLPKMDGLEATKIIKMKDPKVKVLVLSVSEQGVNSKKAVEAGVEKWISKSSSPNVLIDAIREIAH